MRNILGRGLTVVSMLSSALLSLTSSAHAVLYLYEPFNYTAGANLGGVDLDPDPLGPAGTPVGQVGNYAQDFGSGPTYTWYARGTTSNYQSDKDAVVSSGSLSYAGLAASQGNSVSHGSALANSGVSSDPADMFNRSLYANAIALPVPVTSGSLYASFIIRIKSRVEDGTGAPDRHIAAGLVPDLTSGDNAGAALDGQAGTGVAAYGAGFWMRRDPDDVTLSTSNFSPGKSSSDGIGPGAVGPTVGWQRSLFAINTESNQFGDLDGQPFADAASPQTYFVVIKYEFDAQDPAATGQSDTVSLWMNPGSATLGMAGGEALASQNPSGNMGSYYAAIDAVGTATTDVESINSFALFGHRQSTNNTFAYDLDELRIGTTWEDVTPAAAPSVSGDYNGDGTVNAADYTVWRDTLDSTANLAADGDGSNQIGAGDYTFWKARFGQSAASGSVQSAAIPEPATLVLLTLGLLVARLGTFFVVIPH